MRPSQRTETGAFQHGRLGVGAEWTRPGKPSCLLELERVAYHNGRANRAANASVP
jgi:hypothetical protein